MTDDEDTPDYPIPNYYGDHVMCPTVGRGLSKISELKEFYDKHKSFPMYVEYSESLGLSWTEFRTLQKLEKVVKEGIWERKRERRHPATIAPLIEFEKDSHDRWELDVDTLLEEENIDTIDVRFHSHFQRAPKWKQELSRHRSKPVSLKK